MALTTTISALTQATPVLGTFQIPVDTGSYTGKIYVSDFASYLTSSPLTSLSVVNGTITALTVLNSLNAGPISAGAITATSLATSADVTVGGKLTVSGNLVSSVPGWVTSSQWNKLTFITPGVSESARIGSDTAGWYNTTNALLNGSSVWVADDTSKKAFAYIQNATAGRHEFRTALAGPSITWATSATIDELGIQATSGTFGTLTSTSTTSLGTVTATGIISTPIGSFGASSTGAFTSLSSTSFSTTSLTTSTLTASSLTASSLAVPSLNGTPVGNVTPSTGTFTTLISGTTTHGLTTATAINSTPIGNATPSTGAFTTMAASSLAVNTTSAIRPLSVGGGEISLIQASGTNAYFNISDAAGSNGSTYTLTVRGLASAGTSSATLAGINLQASQTVISGALLPSTGGINIGSSGSPFATLYGTSTSAQYADLAENYESDSDYEPGTVLVFGDVTEVTVSNKENDTRVAGIVSTNPAYLMNSTLDGVAVALTGRVPCKVTGTVRRGDLMVSSSIPGVAMTNNSPSIGTVIGKALGNHSGDGVGVIEVVVGRV